MGAKSGAKSGQSSDWENWSVQLSERLAFLADYANLIKGHPLKPLTHYHHMLPRVLRDVMGPRVLRGALNQASFMSKKFQVGGRVKTSQN